MNDVPGVGETPDQPPAEGEMSAEEADLRRRIEAQMRELRVQDLLLESLAGIIQLTARRIEKEDERDLDQARVGIDAARAVVDLLDPGPAAQVKAAVSELQMRFARVAGSGASAGEGGADTPATAPAQPGPGGPDEAPPRLWTPHGSDS